MSQILCIDGTMAGRWLPVPRGDRLLVPVLRRIPAQLEPGGLRAHEESYALRTITTEHAAWQVLTVEPYATVSYMIGRLFRLAASPVTLKGRAVKMRDSRALQLGTIEDGPLGASVLVKLDGHARSVRMPVDAFDVLYPGEVTP